jgi:hypothetical protein
MPLSVTAMPRRLDLHEDFSREDHVAGASDRKFGLLFAAVFGAVGFVRWWLGHTWWEYWLGGALLFLIVAFVAPSVLAPLNRLWHLLGLLLHKVVNPLVMAFLFVSCIVPMGLVMRVFGKDFLSLRLDRNARSYWVKRYPPGISPDTMKNQF